MSLRQRLEKEFELRFGRPPDTLVRAPGRVNLIGEHTDYNDGFVLPMAIDRAVWIASRQRDDGQLLVHALDFDDSVTLSLSALRHEERDWVNYLQGIAWSLLDNGYGLVGWEGVIAGDAPIGAGLSSSAALEMATARTFAVHSGLPWDPARMARICQQADHGWLGIQSGIMDQLISGAGEKDHALLIDCRSLDMEAVPLPPGALVVVLDTKTRRGLVDSAYNERWEQCQAAARMLGVASLRDVDLVAFQARAAELDPLLRQRARHVISENERTLAAAAAMKSGNSRRLGELMDASHESLRDDYEVSSAALNAMVKAARAQPACLGARMTGAGFGGCAIALVEESGVTAFSEAVTNAYQTATQITPELYVCRPAAGVQVFAV